MVSILINPDVVINKMKAGLDGKRGGDDTDFRMVTPNWATHLLRQGNEACFHIMKSPLAVFNWTRLSGGFKWWGQYLQQEIVEHKDVQKCRRNFDKTSERETFGHLGGIKMSSVGRVAIWGKHFSHTCHCHFSVVCEMGTRLNSGCHTLNVVGNVSHLL